MGILCDLVIADRTEASTINRAEGGHLQKWTCLESKGVDPVKLAKLWAILSAEAFDPRFMSDDTILDEASEDGPWTMLVPEKLLFALVDLGAEQIESVGLAWAETEEFKNDGWPAEAVLDYFQELVRFVRQARANRKDVLLWMSL